MIIPQAELANPHVLPSIAILLVTIDFQPLPGLKAIVTKVVYDPTLNAPEDRPYPFVYFITIQNDGKEAVTIFGRKWIVSDDEGRTEVYEGDGVVGQFPCIEPGRKFRYNSYHVVAAGAAASGAFFGETDDGEWIFTRIPEFRLDVPNWA